MLTLDGSHGEGGGALVRIALALSTITGVPFEIKNIRQGREKPGLKSQHLHCIEALKQLCKAEVQGAGLGSEYIVYKPGPLTGTKASVDIGTAGSIGLLMQAAILPCLFSKRKVTLEIKGGTEGKWAPPWDYFCNVFVPQLQRYATITPKLIQRGYYPKGGGEVVVEVKPIYKISDYENFADFRRYLKANAPTIQLTDQGTLIHIKGISHASTTLEDKRVAERQAEAAQGLLSQKGCPVEIRVDYNQTFCPGSGITLWSIFSTDTDEIDLMNPIRVGADGLGEKSISAEDVGTAAAERLLQQMGSGAPVDSYLADQILPYMALVGSSEIYVSEITDHTLSNIHLIERFLGPCFEVDEERKVIKTL